MTWALLALLALAATAVVPVATLGDEHWPGSPTSDLVMVALGMVFWVITPYLLWVALWKAPVAWRRRRRAVPHG